MDGSARYAIGAPEYQPRSGVPAPWEHQAEAFRRSADRRFFALFMEQRTGKSRVVVDTLGYRYRRGDVDAAIIVAWPSGVHRNWADEIEAYLPEDIKRAVVVWRSGQSRLVGFQRKLKELLEFGGLAVATFNAEAIITEPAKDFLRRLLAKRTVALIADESGFLRTPGAQRTKVMLGLSKHPKVILKRILDGTPMEQVMDLYSQLTFLDPSILGLTSFYAFKNRYAEWEKKLDRRSGRSYETLKSYRNLDELKARIDQHAFRVTRAECADLAPKVYQKRFFELSAEQRRVYDSLRETFQAELRSGATLTVANVLTRYLRLQQVASGYLPILESVPCPLCAGAGCGPCDGTGTIEASTGRVEPISDENPRLDALQLELEGCRGSVIVWCRFRQDVSDAIERATLIGRSAVRYDGSTGPEERVRAISDFQAGNATVFVGNVVAGSRGIRLDRAETIVYYSNSFSLLVRLQSEDRAEAIDRKRSTGVVDIVAEGTVDEKIVSALREKKSLADLITGDNPGAWI